MAEGERRVSMRIRKVALAAVAVLLAGGALAFPTTASAALPGFTCGTQSFTSPDPTAGPITDIKIGRHDSESPAYDRFVVVFDGTKLPSWQAIPKASALFYDGLGNRVPLEGNAGIKLTIHSTDAHTIYHGPYDFDPEFRQLAEAESLEDSEGYVAWGLGLEHQSCKRIFALSSPTRLVIDVPQ
jgi:hypothetical protein